MCGGSSPSGETKYSWNDDMRGPWLGTIDRAAHLSEDPYKSFQEVSGGTRTAPINGFHADSLNYLQNMARMSSSPIGSMDGARGGIEDTLSGQYLNANPYTRNNNRFIENTNAYAGIQNNPWVDQHRNSFASQTNPWQNVSAQSYDNQFKGLGPTFEGMLDAGTKKITDAYQRGTARDLQGQAALSGAFGGSAHQNALANNQGALGEQLSNYVNSATQQQFERSAGLEENAINRSMQNQQFDKTMGGNWYDAMLGRATGADEGLLNRGAQSYQQMLDRGFQSEESALGRGYQSDENAAQRGFTGYSGERDRMMSAIPMGQNEQGLAYQRIQQLMGGGDFMRGVDQQYRDENYQDYLGQQNWPYKSLDFLSSILSRAQGGVGPTTTMYSGGGNQAGNILGGLLGAYGMM